MSDQPPKWASSFLRWYCDPDLIEDLQGDLHELYQKKIERRGKTIANFAYNWWVLRSFRPSALKRNLKLKNSFFNMTRNNFKIAFRVLWRDKLNTGLNLLGLTIGIACFLLLGLYVKQELSYDQFHSKKDRIYRTWLKEDYGDGKIFFNSTTPFRFETLLEENFPEIEAAVQYNLVSYLVGRGESRLTENVAIISQDFFKVFDFTLIEGNPQNLMPTKDNLIISQSFVKKYFGDRDPMGQVLPVQIGQDIRDFTVSGVFQDIRRESSIQFDLAISTENNADAFGQALMNAWFVIAPETYVLVKEQSTITSVEGKMQDVVMSYLAEEVERNQYQIGFQALTDIHLNPDVPLGFAPVSNPQYVLILGIIGLLVLIIACVNYTTLSAGQSLKRSKEVGMRKVLGAVRTSLVYQYLSESLLLAFAAMLIGVIVTIILIPAFNFLTGTQIFYQFEWWHIGVYAGVGIFIGVLAGTYPSFVLSGLKSISILRGGNQSPGKLTIRRGLVVLQFLITVFLISTTLIMKQQVSFLKNKDLGYDYKAVVSTQLNAAPTATRLTELISTGMENGNLLKARLETYPEISKIAMGSHVFGTSGWANVSYTDDENIFRRFRLLVVDPYYIEAFNIKMKEGRSFEPESGLDRRQSVILNETAARYFGLESAVGKRLPGNEFEDHQIIGVTEDFHFSSLHSDVEPLVIVQNVMPIAAGLSDANFVDSITPKLVFTYTGTDLTKATEILKREWEATFPNESWNYDFIDDRIKAQYESEARMNKLIEAATFLSLLIAGLGLLGLTMLVVNSKVKEIGIRKVMGASPMSIFQLLAKGFTVQLVIAILLSVPLTLWLMSKWLENFAYRVDMEIWMFLVSGLITVLVASMVIGYHTLKAARVNPVVSLRTE